MGSTPVIMLTQSMEYGPFDLRRLRRGEYSYMPKGTLKLEETLARTIKTVVFGLVSHA